MAKKTKECWNSLGLADPLNTRFNDLEFGEIYSKFCSSMKWLENQIAIKVNGDLLSNYSSRASSNITLALIHPGKSLLSKLQAEWSNIDDRFDVSDDYKLIVKRRNRGRILLQLNQEMVESSPGMCGVIQLTACRFNHGWAIVLYSYEGCDVPIILGFARTDNIPRNVATVVGVEDTYVYESSSNLEWMWPTKNKDLILACWSRPEECNYSNFFLQFTDSELEILRKRYRSLANPELIDSVNLIVSMNEELTEESIDLNLFAKFFGRPSSYDYLDRIKEDVETKYREAEIKWERERIESLEKRIQEIEEKKLREQQLYAEAAAKPPESFPSQMTIDRLRDQDIRSLKKWMQEVLGLEVVDLGPCEIRSWYSKSTGKPNYFRICYKNFAGEETNRLFSKPYPTIRQAVEEAIPGYRNLIQ